MAMTSPTPTPTRITAAVDALAELVVALARLAPSAHTRALRAKADSYQKVVDRWISIPPTAAQNSALLELVVELRSQVDAALAGAEPLAPSSERVTEPPPSSRVARVTLKPGSK